MAGREWYVSETDMSDSTALAKPTRWDRLIEEDILGLRRPLTRYIDFIRREGHFTRWAVMP